MSVAFIVCPGCQALLLPDTAQCPTCHHVLDESRMLASPDAPAVSDGEQEEPCANCHEMVRVGLVRCWKCGNFMRPEIQEAYERMQASPRPVIYSPLPEIGSTSDSDQDESGDSGTYSLSGGGDDDDFELMDDVEQTTDDDFDYDGGFGSGGDEDSATIPLAVEAESPPQPPAEEPPSRPEPEEAAAATTESQPADKPQAAAGDRPERKTDSQDESQIPHSEATGGDALLQVALDEEKESTRRRKGGRRKRALAPDSILVYCPNGHRVEVHERHRGRTGRCPKCKAPFVVPLTPAITTEESQESEAQSGPLPAEQGIWLHDLTLHKVDPTKLKLKPGSLQALGDPIDIWLLDDAVWVIQLAKPGLFGPPDQKAIAAAREKLVTALNDNLPIDDAPAVRKWKLDPSDLNEIRVMQPAAYAHESMFAGIAVFGEGRIAVRLPFAGDKNEVMIASMGLLNFRELSQHLARVAGVEDLGLAEGIPLVDTFENVACHYSEQLMKPLQNIEFYEADKSAELVLIGWRCAGCELVVSEDARKKEKIGGLSGKGIAKAKCPKCSQKFGNNPLYVRKHAGGDEDEDGTTEPPGFS